LRLSWFKRSASLPFRNIVAFTERPEGLEVFDEAGLDLRASFRATSHRDATAQNAADDCRNCSCQ
jgi:hypothetical protein